MLQTQKIPQNRHISSPVLAMIKKNNFLRPFGVGLKNRDFSSEKYRYGFNGMEKDDEVKGKGNSYDFGARMLDSRLGRWLTIDPQQKMYHSFSPYNYTLNSPIANKDTDGERTYFAPGLGNDPAAPAQYVQGVKEAFTKYLGDKFMLLEHSNTGTTGGDIKFAVEWGSKPMLKSSDHILVKNAVDDISMDLAKHPLEEGEKFNLVGTSMGSITTAQTAITLLEEGVVGHIDNLMLVGSPIDKNSELYKKLEDLQKSGKIGKIHYDKYVLEGDLVTGVAGTNKAETVLKGIRVMISFARHYLGKKHVDVHAALAENKEFGEDIAKMTLGFDKIEGEDVSKKVISESSSNVMEDPTTGGYTIPENYSPPSFPSSNKRK